MLVLQLQLSCQSKGHFISITENSLTVLVNNNTSQNENSLFTQPCVITIGYFFSCGSQKEKFRMLFHEK